MSHNDGAGPWRVDGSIATYYYARRVRTDTAQYFKSLQDAQKYCEQLKAQERVRDAAPDLLAACEMALDVIEAIDPDRPAVELLRAAIKGATA